MLLGEPDAPAVLGDLERFDQVVASALMRVELRRLGIRTGRLADADRLLAGVALVPLDAETLAAAETVPPHELATLDAIHLVVALRLADAGFADAMMTYDRRLAGAAAAHGLPVRAPA